MADEEVGVVIQRFYTKYITKEVVHYDAHTGKPVRTEKIANYPVDYVDIGPLGYTNKTMTPHRIRDLEKDISGLWKFVEPKYKAWKAGETLPDEGTPLAAWNGCTPEQADILRVNNVRSVEQLARLSDGHLEGVKLMGLRGLRDQAKAYVAAASTRDTAAAFAKKDSEIAALKEQMAELMAAVRERGDEEEPAKRRPGRPRKDEGAEAEAA
jgi:hypothetical protein